VTGSKGTSVGVGVGIMGVGGGGGGGTGVGVGGTGVKVGVGGSGVKVGVKPAKTPVPLRGLTASTSKIKVTLKTQNRTAIVLALPSFSITNF